MPVMQMRRGAEEPFLADLALEGARRQVGVRLARGGALDVGMRRCSASWRHLAFRTVGQANLVSAWSQCYQPTGH